MSIRYQERTVIQKSCRIESGPRALPVSGGKASCNEILLGQFCIAEYINFQVQNPHLLAAKISA